MIKKYGLRALSGVGLIFLIAILFSPYREYDEGRYLVQAEIFIPTTTTQVYDYLGKSVNASKWSSFVSHITPLNPEEYADGTVGSRRRCYKHRDETGATWDELIISAIPDKLRRLTIYNLQNFMVKSDCLLTEQWYEPTPDGGCNLSLVLFLSDEATWSDWVKLKITAYYIQSIFRKNIENIKNEIRKNNTGGRLS